MKKLFITLSLLITFLTLTAQEEFNGMWNNEGSEYIKTILASEYKVLNVYNTSFEEYQIIAEEIDKCDKNKFTTSLYNPSNGYSVKIEYTLTDANTITCISSGDLNEKYTLTRLY